MGPEPGLDLSRSQDRPDPERVPRERAQAEPFAGAPRLGAGEDAGGFAAGFTGSLFRGEAESEPEPLTLETLFDIYREEVTPTKTKRSRRYERTTMAMFLKFFGRRRKPATLSQRDWDRFIRARRAGRVGPSGRPVSNRTIEYDLKFLLTVLNWAARSRDEEGRLLLESNPLRGLKSPKQKNPARVLVTDAEYQALLKASLLMDWRFRVALVIAHGTGHRIGAIRQLRWSDIDMEGRTIRWRAEHEKTGHEHRTPVTPEALAALEEARRRPPRDRGRTCLPGTRGSLEERQPLTGAHQVAEGPDVGGAGTQASPRVALAEAEVRLRPHEPVLCELGGWKTAETVLRCYQRADEDQLRKALEDRRKVSIPDIWRE